MIQIKLRLNSDKSRTVYAANGKKFYLKPGQNILNLDESDYRSLSKALRIDLDRFCNTQEKVEESEKNTAFVEKDALEKSESEKSESAIDNCSEESNDVIESEKYTSTTVKSVLAEHTDATVEDLEDSVVENTTNVEEQVEEHIEKDVDYSTWTYTQLKAKYKSITGTACKLKKNEIIEFLQEHYTDA
jgi:hypothetical protein